MRIMEQPSASSARCCSPGSPDAAGASSNYSARRSIQALKSIGGGEPLRVGKAAENAWSAGTALVIQLCMVTTLFLVVVLVVALRSTTAEERARFARMLLAAVRRAANACSNEPSGESLGDRTPWTVVTPTVVALNAIVFLLMLVGRGSLGDPETLVRWGANFGPLTTNGEWWRLLTALFVHAGALEFLVNVAGLVQLGLVLERRVGHVAFAVTYVASGVCAGMVRLVLHPVTVTAGASAAIFGTYGLVLALIVWNSRRRSSVTIPLITIKRLAPAAAVFLLYNVVTASADGAAHLAHAPCRCAG